jgi:hypothetical protein|tara:strand:+ start:75 stop:209 length:135 start_codon:yes stop_codon:yes gene_type:complete
LEKLKGTEKKGIEININSRLKVLLKPLACPQIFGGRYISNKFQK